MTIILGIICIVLLFLLAVIFMRLRKNEQLNRQDDQRRENIEALYKERLKNLEQQSATYAAVFSSIPDLIFTKDLTNHYIQVNKSFELYFNLSHDEVVGKTISELSRPSPKDAELYHKSDLQVINGKVTITVEEPIFSPFLGETRFFEVIKIPLLDKYREVKSVLCIARDITKRREAEAVALEASQAKGNFLSHMSHEIRTPLNAIIGMTRITRDSLGNPEKAAKSIDQVMLASDHLLELLNDVLDMSKIESGKFEIADEPFDLQDILGEVSSIINQRCREKIIHFRINQDRLDGERLQLVGDKLRLKQVLINLLGNAVKFTGQEGRIVLYVDKKGETADSVSLEFAVADDGIGMTEDQMKHLFNAFEQADSTIAGRFGGTGLGLAISRNLIKLMGSDITVESKFNEGTTFRFDLTLRRAGAEAEIGIAEEEAINLDLAGKRILLVEDIEVNRLIITEILSDSRVDIIQAENGQDAVEKFGASPQHFFDLIFMDVQMPVMDGYEAAQAIRGMDREDAAGVPIIAMTANAYQEDINMALAAGMNGHVSKPIDFEKVNKLLYDILVKGEKDYAKERN
ncbi:ATP-binding protein [Leadbettera azotonutricia]|uniref:histidine kinase n=1 Tax=Leadbettera azotonutricia (strain ATCC BAA-888 / DSM 13862 / ZAS-9) TaxID=545695 RepID=F5YBF6_LEAAZ|nr:ATP-binding protein [Leadbettera azotonutricia]AEF82363.1 PAS domain protein [Leadbettera azotonutricia ZAS-9]